MQNPREHGTALKGNSELIRLWRYRIGKYRVISEMKDEDMIILVIRIAKRD